MLLYERKSIQTHKLSYLMFIHEDYRLEKPDGFGIYLVFLYKSSKSPLSFSMTKFRLEELEHNKQCAFPSRPYSPAADLFKNIRPEVRSQKQLTLPNVHLKIICTRPQFLFRFSIIHFADIIE